MGLQLVASRVLAPFFGSSILSGRVSYDVSRGLQFGSFLGGVVSVKPVAKTRRAA